MLEGFVQRTSYAPLILRALPQLNLDAPRLLSHLLLYPIDAYLEKKTGGSFARWMDDINFGIDNRAQANAVIRALERLLARVELKLSSRKTEILSRQEAAEYLFVKENFELTDYKKALQKADDAVETIEKLYEDYLHFASKGPRKKRPLFQYRVRPAERT